MFHGLVWGNLYGSNTLNDADFPWFSTQGCGFLAGFPTDEIVTVSTPLKSISQFGWLIIRNLWGKMSKPPSSIAFSGKDKSWRLALASITSRGALLDHLAGHQTLIFQVAGFHEAPWKSKVAEAFALRYWYRVVLSMFACIASPCLYIWPISRGIMARPSLHHIENQASPSYPLFCWRPPHAFFAWTPPCNSCNQK